MSHDKDQFWKTTSKMKWYIYNCYHINLMNITKFLQKLQDISDI